MKLLLLCFSCATCLLFSCESPPPTMEKKISLSEEVTIAEIHKAYETGTYNVVDVVNFYLERIDSIDAKGPGLNAVLTLNPNALEQAMAMNKVKIKGALYGIPVFLKDNIDTKDDMPTTAGSLIMKESYAKEEAPLVKQLKDAGAIILGKANLSEWANFHSNISSSGWSGLGGQTKNPYKLDHNPCGSSAGSGAAVAANLCVIAIGTETNGSIVCPANNNGIVGIKPTVGLISRRGIIPISHYQDTAGPMARSVKDAVIALGTMTASDPMDSATGKEDRNVKSDYTSYLKEGSIKGKRIGYYSKPLKGDSTELSILMERTIQVFKNAGADVIEIKKILGDKTEAHSFTVLKYEFKDGLNKYLAGLGEDAPVKSLSELVDLTFQDSTEMKFDHLLLKTSDEMGDLSDDEYKEALKSMLLESQKDGLDKVIVENRLDAIIAPTGGPAWPTDHINGDAYDIYSSSPAAISGYPSITVPMGFIGELPVGVSIFGLPWTEGELISIAYDYEQKTKHRQSPKYIN